MCTFANSELISNEEENCYALIQSDIKMFMVQYSAVLYFDCECLSLQYKLWTMHIWIWWTNNFWLCGYKIQCAMIMIDENGHELTIDALISACGNTLLKWSDRVKYSISAVKLIRRTECKCIFVVFSCEKIGTAKVKPINQSLTIVRQIQNWKSFRMCSAGFRMGWISTLANEEWRTFNAICKAHKSICE